MSKSFIPKTVTPAQMNIATEQTMQLIKSATKSIMKECSHCKNKFHKYSSKRHIDSIHRTVDIQKAFFVKPWWCSPLYLRAKATSR